MSVGTLYTITRQNHGKAIRAVVALTGQKVDIPTDYEHFKSNKEPAFLSKFPHGKIPAFESKDGFKLFEGVAIARYLAALKPTPNLLGNTKEEAALIDQWVSFVNSELQHHIFTVRMLMGHYIPYNKALDQMHRDSALRALTTLNGHLMTHTFIASHRLSLADLYTAVILQGAFATLLDAELRAKLPNLQRYYETVINQKGLLEIYDETTYIDKAVHYTPPPKEKKEEKPKEEKPKEAKKEEKKKEEKPKKPADDDDDDDVVVEEPKAKNPLDELPKSTFNLEDWKRAYSNMDTRGSGGSLEWFYEKFDKAGFSLWRIDFKYNQELTQVFMSSNQITGFYNRLEGSRKYLFGSMGVLGTANNSVISGALICRGQDYKPVVNVAPDWESYSYTPLHVVGPDAKAEDKKFFEAAMAWDLEIDGKKWADGKAFK